MASDTRVDEIADGIYRISTFLSGVLAPEGVTVNQFLVMAEEPLLFHTGMRSTFPALVSALRPLLPMTDLRWVSFGHVEADECGALEPLLAVAPSARVASGDVGWPATAAELSDRPVHVLRPADRLDLGGRRLLHVPTPHAPHNREAQVLFEETTGTLLSGDLFAQVGRGPAIGGCDLVAEALATEEAHPCASPGPAVPDALRNLALLGPRTIATMHGTTFEGDGTTALLELAKAWEVRFGQEARSVRGDGLRSPHG